MKFYSVNYMHTFKIDFSSDWQWISGDIWPRSTDAETSDMTNVPVFFLSLPGIWALSKVQIFSKPAETQSNIVMIVAVAVVIIRVRRTTCLNTADEDYVNGRFGRSNILRKGNSQERMSRYCVMRQNQFWHQVNSYVAWTLKDWCVVL